jgi:hypothetical protein
VIAYNTISVRRTQNVAEAVALASKLKSEGTYDWFRGQINNWSLRSTRARLKAAEEEEATSKLERFFAWIHGTPGLESITGTPDSVVAVAQHYGLPTNFVDFTTEPAIAGFFASYGRPRKGMESCIICLNTDDLRKFWKVMPPEYRSPEFLKLEVPNLWRVEAQLGRFLYCPYPDFENIYDLDRIVFPYTGPVGEPAVDDVYPRRKSNLEGLLDQFFMSETLLAGQKRLESMPVPFRVFHIETAECDPNLVKGNGPPAHNSWDAIKLGLWLTPTVEELSSAVTDEHWRFDIDNSVRPATIARRIEAEVARRLSVTPQHRSKLISWQFRFGKGSKKRLKSSVLSEAVQRLWDGLRTLPYTAEDLAVGIGNCVGLYLNHLDSAPSVFDPRSHEACSVFGDETIEIEFGASDGSYSRGYVSKRKLREAVREDIGEYLAPKYQTRLKEDITTLLQAVTAPHLLFDFERLTTLFAREISPSQVLSRFAGDVKRHSSPVFFSAARLNTLGLP